MQLCQISGVVILMLGNTTKRRLQYLSTVAKSELPFRLIPFTKAMNIRQWQAYFSTIEQMAKMTRSCGSDCNLALFQQRLTVSLHI